MHGQQQLWHFSQRETLISSVTNCEYIPFIVQLTVLYGVSCVGANTEKLQYDGATLGARPRGGTGRVLPC